MHVQQFKHSRILGYKGQLNLVEYISYHAAELGWTTAQPGPFSLRLTHRMVNTKTEK